jgi:hypothetical protein
MPPPQYCLYLRILVWLLSGRGGGQLKNKCFRNDYLGGRKTEKEMKNLPVTRRRIETSEVLTPIVDFALPPPLPVLLAQLGLFGLLS